jgi:hypothetical protein
MSSKNTGLSYIYHVRCVTCSWRVPLLARTWHGARSEAYQQGWHQTKNGWMCPRCYRSYSHAS